MQDKLTPRRFEVMEMAIGCIEALRPWVARVRQRDRDLGEQLRRALSSVALNIGEGSAARGGHALERYGSAAGSCREARTALRVAVAWGYVARGDVAEADARLDRIGAILYRLCAGR